MAKINAILSLHESGHSHRKIARLLGVHRETVGRYVAAEAPENRPNAPTGSSAPRRRPTNHLTTLLPYGDQKEINEHAYPFTCRF
jgi:hypothetical protein